MSTDIARPLLLTRDWKILRIVLATLVTTVAGKVRQSLSYAWNAWRTFPAGPIAFLTSLFDPNDTRHASFEHEGLFFVPFSTECGRRVSIRDLLNLTLQDYRDNLTIYSRTLATRLLFEETNRRTDQKRSAWRSWKASTSTKPTRASIPTIRCHRERASERATR